MRARPLSELQGPSSVESLLVEAWARVCRVLYRIYRSAGRLIVSILDSTIVVVILSRK